MTNETPVTLITGASSGIGRALANAVARERGRVALIGRHEERLARVAREVEMFGGEPLIFVSDVRDPASVRDALTQTLDAWGRVDVAVLSSGIGVGLDTAHLSSAPVEEMFQTNVFGVVHWLAALQPVLQTQAGGGTIAVLSSLAADRALPGGGAAYCASKAAVSSLCDGLRAPLSRQNIRLVTVEPGFIATPMTARNPRMPFLMQPEESARLILDGLQRGSSVIRFPRSMSALAFVGRLLPPAWVDKFYRE